MKYYYILLAHFPKKKYRNYCFYSGLLITFVSGCYFNESDRLKKSDIFKMSKKIAFHFQYKSKALAIKNYLEDIAKLEKRKMIVKIIKIKKRNN
jgi:hypothetical protein